MDLSWFETVPEPTRSVLIKIAGDVTMRLLDAAGYQVKKHFRDTPEQEALTKALAQGLYTTFSKLTDNTDLVAHYVGLFGEWTEREAVAGELSQLIDPRDEAELDLELLRQEFEALGYAPDMLGENVEFEVVVARFAGAFYDAAAKQPELQAQMQIGLLRGIAERAQQQTQLQKQIAQAVAPDLTAEDESYLAGLTHKLDHLPLGGVDPRDVGPGRDGQEITLRKVYVDLDTTSTVQEEVPEDVPLPPEMGMVEGEGRRLRQRPEGALEALVDRERMVLLGDPGSGKTTFLRHVALTCADTWLGHANENADLLAGLGERLFPLVVTLRQFTAGLDPEAEPHRRLILEHLQKLLNCDQAPRTYWPTVRQRLHTGEAVLLLDGYDEVDSAQRQLVAGIVCDLLDHFPALPVLITSRTRAYEAEKTPKFSLPALSLADLSPEQIETFAGAWYEEMARLDPRYDKDWADQRAGALLEAVQTREQLGDMARTPLLLTMMARVNARQPLPDSRVELYAEVLDQLLWEWEKRRSEGEASDSLYDFLSKTGKTKTHFLFWLADFAFEQHEAQGARRDVADVPAWEVEDGLRSFHGGEDEDQRVVWARRVLRMMSERNGVLLWQGEQALTFPHRSFQEYLAAVHVAEKENAGDVAQLARAGDHWHEVILLAAGYLVQRAREDQAVSYVDEILPREPETDEDWTLVKLAAEVLAVIPAELRLELQRGRELAERVPGELVRLLEQGALEPVERAAAGVTLGTLGDPRFDGPLELPEDLDNYFVPIAGGTFTMGSTDEEITDIKANAEWYRERLEDWDKYLDWEQPAHPVTVADFRMARYLVTNAQYRVFIDDGGYEDAGLAAWWTKAGREAWREELFQRWGLSGDGPGQWSNSRLNTPNAPVVGVSWFEAVAYCNWLTAQLREMGYLDDARAIRLPTEPEWEYAARGVERRTYPWGDAWDTEALNWAGVGIGVPSAVGAFPAGATPKTGLLDVAGNVWQWCQTRWDDYPYDAQRESLVSEREGPFYEPRCLRGGSWGGGDPGEARCAARRWSYADLRLYYYGFRVVLSHLS